MPKLRHLGKRGKVTGLLGGNGQDFEGITPVSPGRLPMCQCLEYILHLSLIIWIWHRHFYVAGRNIPVFDLCMWFATTATPELAEEISWVEVAPVISN